MNMVPFQGTFAKFWAASWIHCGSFLKKAGRKSSWINSNRKKSMVCSSPYISKIIYLDGPQVYLAKSYKINRLGGFFGWSPILLIPPRQNNLPKHVGSSKGSLLVGGFIKTMLVKLDHWIISPKIVWTQKICLKPPPRYLVFCHTESQHHNEEITPLGNPSPNGEIDDEDLPKCRSLTFCFQEAPIQQVSLSPGIP